MRSIKIEDWKPTDGLTLEENALAVATSTENSLVVAGPGAGKTELLAQRACFLLQTNTCKFPHKILAISFKRDAAFNLKERVKTRCGDELSKRFDSFTFDSFAKQLVDRFRLALPHGYAITADYDVILRDATVLDTYRAVNQNYRNTTNDAEIQRFHNAVQLPLPLLTGADRIRKQAWDQLLGSNPTQLTFKMIMRLGEYIINSNPKIKQFLQETYHYVFLDEFQDATSIQYDFFKSCFLGSNCVFTAVGDDKQRIMTWAGAHEAVFDEYMEETGATREPLTMNFRSAPRLVTLLNHLTRTLLGKDDMATASSKWNPDDGECDIWLFETQETEIQTLFDAANTWIDTEGLNPRDICILVKQRPDTYAGALIELFTLNGIKARDENKFQELLTRDISLYVINCLYAIFDKKAGIARQAAFSFLSNLHTEFEDEQLLRLEMSFYHFTKRINTEFSKDTLKAEQLSTIVDEIIGYANIERIRSAFPNFRNARVLKGHIEEITAELVTSFEKSEGIIESLDVLTGKDTIPVMTVHKSKGLEYHSVIFVGLEDSAFWTFQRQPDEDKRTFFVALSRAKERVVFTFSKTRAGNDGQVRQQSFANIKVILEELQKSGVVNIEKK